MWIYTTGGGTITEIGRNDCSRRRSILEIRDFVEAESGGWSAWRVYLGGVLKDCKTSIFVEVAKVFDPFILGVY